MTSDVDDVPREEEPAVPPDTDGDDERPVADDPPEADPATRPDAERELPDG